MVVLFIIAIHNNSYSGDIFSTGIEDTAS